jgi:hypothetical protein
MRHLLAVLILLGSLAAANAAEPAVTSGTVIKVLPLLLDKKGLDSPTPSLFDRDAYQARLRQRTNEITGVRLDVLWKVKHRTPGHYTVRAELRGIGEGGVPHIKSLETEVTPGWFHQWTSFTVDGEDYRQFGTLIAWRATLWEDSRPIGSQQSFLW